MPVQSVTEPHTIGIQGLEYRTMKCSKLAIVFAMSCALSASAASAQDNFGQGSAVSSTAYEYGSYYAQDETPASPSDRPAPEAAAEAPAATAAAPCDSCG